HRESFPMAFLLAIAIRSLPVRNRALTTASQTVSMYHPHRLAAAQIALCTRHSVAPTTCCFSFRRRDSLSRSFRSHRPTAHAKSTSNHADADNLGLDNLSRQNRYISAADFATKSGPSKQRYL